MTDQSTKTPERESKNDYHNSNLKYAVLQETNGEECESWLYFIKYQGNEEALSHLEKQLNSVDFYVIDDMSTFDLETSYLVSEQTAKEMSKIDLNHYSFHRKFDGVLQKIDLKLRDSYNNKKKIKQVFKTLGFGRIEDYIDLEDIDPEDQVDIQESEVTDRTNSTDGRDSTGTRDESQTDSESETETDTESDSESESSSVSSSDSECDKKHNKKTGKLPNVLNKGQPSKPQQSKGQASKAQPSKGQPSKGQGKKKH
jgi:hypothetical protein